MTPETEKFRQKLQKELGLVIGPKDPLLALWLAQQEFLEESATQHQKLLSDFESVLGKSQTLWTDQAKQLANQSLNAALRAARDSTALLVDEAARNTAAAVRAAVQKGVERTGRPLAAARRLAWISLAASIVAFAAVVGEVLVRLIH
jgi:Transcriptional activator TraM